MNPAELKRLREDLYFEFPLRDYRLRFYSTWGLFSPRGIDEGSRLLLKHIEVNPTDNCLDLGCGYGAIGVALSKLAPQGQTLLTDKDFIAIEYARKNLRANNIANAEALPSNGFDHIPPNRRFDLIASNIPAKVGKELLAILLHDAHARLKPHGRLYVVTINGLRRFMSRAMLEVFREYDKVKQGKHHTVAYTKKP